MPVNIRPETAAMRSINRITRTLATTLEINQNLAFLNRTPVINADDDEITAKFEGAIYAADIVADDSRAVTYDFGKMTLSTDNVPNLKFGLRLTQGQIKKLRRYAKDFAVSDPEGLFTDWKTRMAESLLRGIRVRQEALIVAAKLDSVVYDRLGVKIVGSFGTPAALKSTVATLWSNTAATPILDMQMKRAYAQDTYGRSYNRATMSTQEFQRAASTEEFQKKASLQFKFTVAPGMISPYSTDAVELFEAISGFQLEKYDVFFKTKQADASTLQQRVMPQGKVILSNSADDNDEAVFDLANGEITEAIVADMVATLTIGLEGEQYGPATYMAPTSADLNPPGMAMWGVSRNFPRKHDETETAVLTVG